jgi:hypothetical protein
MSTARTLNHTHMHTPAHARADAQLADFALPQRMFLATMSGIVLLLVLVLVMGFQFNSVGNRLELSSPLLYAEIANLNRYALDFAVVRSLVQAGRLPYIAAQWNIGRPTANRNDVAAVEQLADMVPHLPRCEPMAPAHGSQRMLGSMPEAPASRLSLACLLRQFSLRVLSRTAGVGNSSSMQLLSARAQERMHSAAEAGWSAKQMHEDLIGAVYASMAVSLAVSLILSFLTLVALALAYRADVLSARRGRAAPLLNLRSAPLPTAAAMFVGSQTHGLLLGWLIYLCGAFALCFAASWPPLRGFLVANLWLVFAVMLLLWGGALAFSFAAARSTWSPVRLTAGYIRGTQCPKFRGWWGLYEFLALLIHMAASAFSTLLQLIVAVLRQFMRISRLDMATFQGRSSTSDPGHAGYKVHP